MNTNMVGCRVSISGITILIWGSIPHESTWDPLGNPAPVARLAIFRISGCVSFKVLLAGKVSPMRR